MLSGSFPVGKVKNARQYIQYCLCFFTILTKNYLADNRTSIQSAVTEVNYEHLG